LLPTIQSSNATLGAGGYIFNFRSGVTITLNIRNNTFSIGNFNGEEQIERVVELSASTGSVVDFRNNIIYSVETQDIEILNGFGSLASYQFRNNCYFTTGSAYTQVPTGGTNNITVDPLFVDISTDNYNLRPASPAIGTGVLL